ncbi:glycoside hydrolase family 18 protein [Russula decolorans]
MWTTQPTLARSIKALPRTSPLKPTGFVAASWYASWNAADVPLAKVNWTEYNVVVYAFALTTPNASEIGLQDSDKQLLPEFVQAARNYSAVPILSVGGWGGSQFFSSAVATDANRTAFANAILDVVKQYGLDGIEIDWEYPNNLGIGCNQVFPDDSANLLLFLQNLRSMNESLVLSAAVPLKPFLDENRIPMTNVSEFAGVLDYIEIMNYDVWRSISNSVGPNAPLNDSCAPASSQNGSAVSAVQAWKNAEFPVYQMILGVPAYGHSFRVKQSDALDASGDIKLFVPFNKTDQPAGDKWDGNGTAVDVDVCGNPNVVGGVFDFWGLIDAGFLYSNGTPSSASGIYSTFDECSQTPYVYNSTSEVMVSYDDVTSFAEKGKFIQELNLAGFAMWQTGGDYNNLLVNSIRSALELRTY